MPPPPQFQQNSVANQNVLQHNFQKPSLNNIHYIFIGVASLLVVAFFLDWFRFGFFGSYTGLEIVRFGSREFDNPLPSILLPLIPISAIALIVLTFISLPKLKAIKRILVFVPVLALLICIIFILEKLGIGSGHSYGSSNFLDFLQYFGIGFWITLLCSIALPVIANKTKI